MTFFVIFWNYTSAREIIYVKADAIGANTGLSWEDAFTDLQDALAEAEKADQSKQLRIYTFSPIRPPISSTSNKTAHK